MTSELPSTLQLAASPELAALHVLEVALATAERTLLAAHPELDEGYSVDKPARLSTEACLADAIIVHVNGLESALFRYRLHLRARGLLHAPDF